MVRLCFSFVVILEFLHRIYFAYLACFSQNLNFGRAKEASGPSAFICKFRCLERRIAFASFVPKISETPSLRSVRLCLHRRSPFMMSVVIDYHGD